MIVKIQNKNDFVTKFLAPISKINENAVIKVYDFPILFLPRLSHPDPSVDRRSGFLIPSFSDSRNLGESLNVSYFWALNRDKDFTLFRF